jgi:hypothetical protein
LDTTENSPHPQTQVASEKQYVHGEVYSYLGRNYRLEVTEGELTPIKIVQGRFTMSAPKTSLESKLIKYALTSWLRIRAEPKLCKKNYLWDIPQLCCVLR